MLRPMCMGWPKPMPMPERIALGIAIANGDLRLEGDVKITEWERNRLIEKAHIGPIMYEDDLPHMTDEKYDEWYEKSFIPGGVGVRVGPAVKAVRHA